MKRSIKAYLYLALKGFAMGAAEAIPGVSGGTIAFVTGIYEELILNITKLRFGLVTTLRIQGLGAFWKQANGPFFTALLAGMAVSFITVLKTAKWLIANHPILIWSFFFGLILGSTVLVGKALSKWRWSTVMVLLFGAILAFFLTNLPPREEELSDWFLIFAGAIAISAMILPGISGAYILVILGAYDKLGQAVDDLDIKKLLLFGSGLIIGLLSFSRILKWLFAHYRNTVLALLTGFILGSLYKIWPWRIQTIESKWLTEIAVWPTKFPEEAHSIQALVWMLAGLGIIIALESIQKKII